MSSHIRHAFRWAVAVAVVAAVLPGATARADAAGRPPAPRVPSVPITLTATGFPPPATRAAGGVSFEVRNTDATGHWWTVVSARPGVTQEKVAKDLQDSFSSDPAVALPALRAYYEDLNFFGGVAVLPAGSVKFTVSLPPDLYYLTDQLIGAFSPLAYATMQTTAPAATTRPVRHDGVIDIRGGSEGKSIRMPARMPANGSYLLTNHSDQPQEFIFFKVRSDVTDATIQEYFDTVRDGGTPPADPLADQVGGVLAISPGTKAVVKPGFGPGRYAVASFLLDQWTGKKGAYTGLHRVFTLR